MFAPDGSYRLLKVGDSPLPGEVEVSNELRKCIFYGIRPDGRFQFRYTDEDSIKEIFYLSDVSEHERALQALVPSIFVSIRP